MRKNSRSLVLIATLACLAAPAALAQQPAPAPAADQPAAPSHPTWNDPLFGGIQFSGHVEVGATVNGSNPANNVNFGQTFTDRADTVRMNQTLFNVEHDLDPKDAGFQYGFKFTGMYGTDARDTHAFNEFDRVTRSPYQWDIVEADGLFHVPLPLTGGTDIKIGQYPAPIGFETIDATTTPLYSHSYIFNFFPFTNTGVLTTTHINDTLDLWLGWDTGVQGFVGAKGVNNSSVGKGYAGFGLNSLADGKLTVTTLAHLGPENPNGSLNRFGAPFNPNSRMREILDTVITYKIDDNWTAAADIARMHDDYYHATTGGSAQYLIWKFNDQWTFTLRNEIFADQGKPVSTGFSGYVCEATGPLDYTDAGRNLQPNTSYCGPNNGRDYNFTVEAVTIGAAWTPPTKLPGGLSLTIRPELRFNSIIGGSNNKVFGVNSAGVGTSKHQTTAAIDAILSF